MQMIVFIIAILVNSKQLKGNDKTLICIIFYDKILVLRILDTGKVYGPVTLMKTFSYIFFRRQFLTLLPPDSYSAHLRLSEKHYLQNLLSGLNQLQI